ncbi:Peptide methionine sulfoxide reductase MsrA [Alkalicoccus chagannorensis]
MKKAVFAGGCFWCMVRPFEETPGIHSVVSGYTGGKTENPTYEEVCSETTGHVEAVEITYDPELISYHYLLQLFWQQIDPTDPGGQFHDRGGSYTTAIFVADEEQKEAAEKSKKELNENGPFQQPIVTKILPAETFYPAEDYHQRYHLKNPMHYKMYYHGSGRAGFINKYWKENQS